MRTHVGPGIALSAVIIRGCWVCGGKRELGKPCGSCGCADPARVRDLGVIASSERSFWSRLRWRLWGDWKAQRRIMKVNREFFEGHY